VAGIPHCIAVGGRRRVRGDPGGLHRGVAADDWVTADELYGDSGAFLDALQKTDLKHYVSHASEETAWQETALVSGTRWHVELDIRAIKISLGMDVLRCQASEMVRREVWTCLLAYNLIRQTILQAAQRGGRSPRQLSFSAALETIAACWMVVVLMEESFRAKLVDAHLANLARQLVGDRPNRVEPRAIKRRPKEHRLLTKPRTQARAELLAGTST